VALKRIGKMASERRTRSSSKGYLSMGRKSAWAAARADFGSHGSRKRYLGWVAILEN
jgi:hypothetical protein